MTVEAHAVARKAMIIMGDLRNCTGKSRLETEVRKDCWTKNMIIKTPAVMKSPMIGPLCHGYSEPPNEMAIRPVAKIPHISIVPGISISVIRSLKVTLGRGFARGSRKK